MRTPSDIFDLFTDVAESDERIRAMTLEGSRANPNANADPWQDYDITFLVTDVASFTLSDAWLESFGDRVFMQKPEAMELFPPDFPAGWFSYLMLFSDGVKVDLTLVPCVDAEAYFEQDPLIRVLLDKDGICADAKEPTDARFWVQRPREGYVRDSANEFYFACTYVARGLLRGEILFANWMFEQVLRVELLRMLEYAAGARNGFPLNVGKHDKRLPSCLEDDEREALLATYRLDGIDETWRALHVAMDLFERSMRETCAMLSFDCPNDKAKIEAYIETLKAMQDPR